MITRGPIPQPDKQDQTIISHLSTKKGIGFNQLWRQLKNDNMSLSFSTLSKTLKRLINQHYVQVKEIHGPLKIPQRLYTKTSHGAEYQQHLESKLGILESPTKHIIKVQQGTIQYNQQIFSNFPFSYELDLSAPSIDKQTEKIITTYIDDMGETVIHNIAEILNKTYSTFLHSFVENSMQKAFTQLQDGLNFQLKLTLAFDGKRLRLDDISTQLQTEENDLLHAIKAITVPSQTELLGCWIMTLLSPLLPQKDFPYDLSTLDGWATLIEEYGNRWRKEKGVPLLKKKDIKEYLQELIQKGDLSLQPIKVTSRLLNFNKLPAPQPEEFYSFLLTIFSSMKSILVD